MRLSNNFNDGLVQIRQVDFETTQFQGSKDSNQVMRDVFSLMYMLLGTNPNYDEDEISDM